MNKTILFCVSLVQIGPPSFYAPESVVRIAKTRIVEQLNKNYGIEGVFDSDRCSDISNYELFSEGIRLKASPSTWSANLFISYQDLLDGQKINFPLNEDLKNKVQLTGSATPEKKFSSAPTLWIAAIGIGVIAAYLYTSRTSSKQETPQPPVAITPVGVVRSF